jgi:hypothetical protein
MFNWRSTLPAVEDAGEYAMDQLLSAANSAAKSAREVSSQIETWATDGYESLRDAAKSEPAFWGTMALGVGGLIGGLYTLWRKQPRRSRGRRRSARTVAASSGMSSAMNRSTRSTGAAMTAAMAKAKAPRKRSAKKSSVRRKKAA